MKLRDTLEALGIPEAEEQFSPDWDRLMRQMPDPIPFLEPEYVDWACSQAHLSPEMTLAAQSAASRVVADPAPRALAWYWHAKLFSAGEPRAVPRGWPLLTEAMGKDAGMFNVLVLLSGTLRVLEIHRERGIPQDVTEATILDLRLQLETLDYSHEYGHWGISPWILGWLLLHWRGDLVRLGRLQFATSTFGARLRAYRQRETGEVVALSESGVRYRSDGQVDGAGGVFDATGAWTSALEEGDEGIRGNPITPWGDALAEPVVLPGKEWEQALAPGDPILDIHIPTGPPMDYDQCGESIRRALDFFPKHFPDRPFVGFACYSWILDSQFEELLPASSNLVRFQREVYLYPVADGDGVVGTVFGRGLTPEDLPGFPRNTTMQKAFAAHLESGGHFRGGGCFLLKEDVDWGSACYRTHWPF